MNNLIGVTELLFKQMVDNLKVRSETSQITLPSVAEDVKSLFQGISNDRCNYKFSTEEILPGVIRLTVTAVNLEHVGV